MTPMFRAAAILVVAALAGGPAAAGQDDRRLDPLFERLAATADIREAKAIEDGIWRIWLEAGDAEVDAILSQGIAAMNGGKLEAARELFGEVTRRAPELAEGWNKLATVEYLQHDFVASVGDIARTLELEPRHFGALSGLGLINLTLGLDAGALEAFERALDIHPHLPGAREQVTRLRRRLGGEPI